MSTEEQNIFVEQAEYIDEDTFNRWSIEHPDELTIIRKLSQGGAKLITGPRGSGKTTLLLKTYYRLCNSDYSTLPIYVNFKASLKIEPLYRRNSNAVYWFNQWLLFKIYQGIFNTSKELGIDSPNCLRFKKDDVDNVISSIELGSTDKVKEEYGLTIDNLEDEVLKVLELLNKTHCVLLLDDAAHAFSSEQQRDFFDFFRQIKSRYISPKAAIYPGVTEYSSTFHVGHDAEEIDVWIKPESTEYLSFMVGLLQRRLPPEIFHQLESKQELLEILCFSAFGIPRALLNMIQTLYKESSDDDGSAYDIKYDRSSVLKAVRLCLSQAMSIYLSLKVKLPIYEKFVTNGELIFTRMVEALKEYNKEKDDSNQGVIIAIKRPLPIELTKVLSFFQYGGLLMPKGELSKGEKGVFELFSIHYAALVERNAFLGKKSITTASLALALKKRDSHSYKRITPNVLIGTDNVSEIERIGDLNDYINISANTIQSPIDIFYSYIRNILRVANPTFMSSNQTLGPLLLVGIVSATENYFRDVLSRIIEICPIAQECSAEQTICLGSVIWHSGIKVERSSFENISFAGADSIEKTCKKFIRYDINKTGLTYSMLSEYDKVCELRHSIVHSGSIMAGKNAIKLGISPCSSSIAVDVGYRQLQECASVCSTLVISFNTELFEQMCKRWAVDWRRKPSWNPQKQNDEFKRIWKCFYSANDNSNGTILNQMSITKCRNLIKAEFGIV